MIKVSTLHLTNLSCLLTDSYMTIFLKNNETEINQLQIYLGFFCVLTQSSSVKTEHL